MKTLQKIISLLGIHKWDYFKRGNKEYRLCQWCPKKQVLIYDDFGGGIMGPTEIWKTLK